MSHVLDNCLIMADEGLRALVGRQQLLQRLHDIELSHRAFSLHVASEAYDIVEHIGV